MARALVLVIHPPDIIRNFGFPAPGPVTRWLAHSVMRFGLVMTERFVPDLEITFGERHRREREKGVVAR